MMAIVVALLGAFHCGATAALAREGMEWGIVLGGAFIVCGLALVVMIPRSERRRALAAWTLVVGTLTMALGAAAVVIAPSSPFSWMMCVLGVAVFIDTLCLEIGLQA
jgi:peptidoglycan/LPS O-acetylase OafA/YrhL